MEPNKKLGGIVQARSNGVLTCVPSMQMVLDSGPHPLFHFGMAGYSQTKGESGPSYRVPRATTDPLEWPPKYAKVSFPQIGAEISELVLTSKIFLILQVCITFSDADGKEVGKWAFSDARRLGRVKLITAEVPEEGETLSSLGSLYVRFLLCSAHPPSPQVVTRSST